jgi:hypothetical protein
MNKYKKISRKLKRERLRDRGCRNKVAYQTRAAASKQGQDVYRCPYGAHYHRSGSAATLAATLAKRKAIRSGGDATGFCTGAWGPAGQARGGRA